ncbi:hypothetical protein R1sor_003426 [Riccia sorocarpa]|uniref:Uncharacterized protein n=1 Tax=Riccia sorocarpa TaxID=122646 RepID=A0ABD3H5H3_9MARC
MARCKQTAQRKPKTASGQRIEVDAGEVTFPDGVQRTGKVTLVRFDVPDSPTEVRISSPQEDIGVNEYPSSSRPYRDHISSSSSSSEDTEVLGPTHALAKYVASWKASAKAPLDYSDNQSSEHDDGHPEVSSQHAEASPKDNRAEDPQPVEPSNPVPHFDLAEMNAPDPGFTRAGGGERSLQEALSGMRHVEESDEEGRDREDNKERGNHEDGEFRASQEDEDHEDHAQADNHVEREDTESP